MFRGHIQRTLALFFVASIWAGSAAPALRAQSPAAKPAADTPFLPHPLARIEPGTRITDSAPPDWSHLVIKSQPKVTAGNVDKVPAMTVKLASLLFTAILVKVDKQEADGQNRFSLKQVAIGIGARVDGEDTIISGTTYRDLGANLGMVGGIVLSKSEEQLNQVIEVARSLTMAIVDSPTVFVRKDQHDKRIQHVEAVLRYAFLVDPRDGQAYTLVWVLDRNDKGSYRLADSPLILVKPNLITDCEMRVDANKFFLGMPNSDAFAVLKLPQGTRLSMPDEVESLAAERQFTPVSAHRLELSLWKTVFSVKE